MNGEAIWAWDRAVFKTIHLDWSSPFLDAIFHALSVLGLGHYQGLLILLVCGNWPAWFKRGGENPLWKHFWWALFSMAISGLFNQATFKQFLPRERPSNFSWAKPQEPWFHDSFASGHTTTSFGVAFYVLFVTWGTRYWLCGPAMLLLATGIGVSRIYRGVHWPTDVIGGAFIGLIFGAIFAFLYWKTEEARAAELDQPRESDPSL